MSFQPKSAFVLSVLSIVVATGALAQAQGIVLASPVPVPRAASSTWTSTGPMAEARSGAASVVLPDGCVLVIGGQGDGTLLASAELYDVKRGFSPAASMHFARWHHTAVVLPDGRVLVAGGETAGEGPTNSVEIYNPTTDSWTMVNALAEARAGHTATLLANGQVLIEGGANGSQVRASLEIFDPATESFRYAGTLSTPRMGHASVALADGRVLFVGGSDGKTVLASVEIYDPTSGSVSPAASLSQPRAGHSATLLLDGTVLVAGGSNGGEELASAAVYDPWANEWTAVGNLSNGRSNHFAFLLPHNNNVLIFGGVAGGNPAASAELYRPWKAAFVNTGSPEAARADAVGSPLGPDGLLLAAGGTGLASAEVYSFATLKTDTNDSATGKTVTVTGSGWAPGETVDLMLREALTTRPDHIQVNADDSGNLLAVVSSRSSGPDGATVYLTATGAVSEAQIRLVDASPLGPPPRSTTTTITSNNNPSFLGQSVTFTAAVEASQGNEDPNGTVEFSITAGPNPRSLGSASLAACGSGKGRGKACASLSTSALEVGTHTVQGAYIGDTDFLPSSGQLSQTVDQGTPMPTTTTVVSTPNPSLAGEWVNFSASVLVTTETPRPTGTVTFFDGASELATVPLQPGAWATFNTPDLALGAHAITVRYNGDNNFAPSTSAVFTHTVNLGTTATTVVSLLNPSLAGEWVSFSASVLITSQSASATLNASVTALEELRPTGTVTFFDGATELATVPLEKGAWATFNTPDLTLGTHAITARYNGDANFAPNTSAVLTQTVNQGNTTTTVVSSPNPSLAGEWVNFSASVLIGSENFGPTGTVTFFDGATELATVPLQPGAWATYNTPDLAIGPHAVTARYNGDSNFTPSTSTVLTQTVNLGTTATTVVSSLNPSLAGEWVNFSASVLISSQSASATLRAGISAAEELRPTGTTPPRR